MAENKNLETRLSELSKLVDQLLAEKGLSGGSAPKPAPKKETVVGQPPVEAAPPSPMPETPAAVAPSAPAAGAPTQDPAASSSQSWERMSSYKGLPIVYKTIQAENGAQIGARLVDGKIHINKKGMADAYERFKAGTYLVDGVVPPTATIDSFDAFVKFALEHEYQHSKITRDQGETKADYENKVNQAASQELMAPESATSPVSDRGGLPVPPQGETPVSVAPEAISGDPAMPPQAPEKMATAATPDELALAKSAPSPDLLQKASSIFAAEPEADQGGYDEEIGRTASDVEGPRVAIIGTAGRKENSTRLTEADWAAMLADAEAKVTPDTVLVSGGAAWADHIAVKLFLDGKVAGLILHLPYPETVQEGTGVISRAEEIARYYHKMFSEKVYGNPEASIDQIEEAIQKGARVTYSEGRKSDFFVRNEKIARDATDGMIAYTFDPLEDGPNDSGTGHTWSKSMLDIDKKDSVDIRELRPDPSERRRVESYRARQLVKRGSSETEQMDNARRRATMQILGKSAEVDAGKTGRTVIRGMSVKEIGEERKKLYGALDGMPKTIDSEISNIGGELSDEDGVVVRSRVIGDLFDAYGRRKEEVAGARNKFIAALERAGVPTSALLDATADGSTDRTKPFFSSKKGMTIEAADASNLRKAKAALREIVLELETLKANGTLKAVTHPEVSEGLEYLLRQIFAYRSDIASGEINNVFGQESSGRYDRKIAQMTPEQATQVFAWMETVMTENGTPELLELMTEITEMYEEGKKVRAQTGEEDTGWAFKSEATGQVIDARDVMSYANGTVRGYRKYALDEAGIVPPEWIDVDENGLGIEFPSVGGLLTGTDRTKARIEFQLKISEDMFKETGAIEEGPQKGKLRRLGYPAAMALEDFMKYKIGRKVGAGESIAYTRDATEVSRVGKDIVARAATDLGAMKVYVFPDSFHLISDTGTITAGGRTVHFGRSEQDGPTVIVVNDGDDMDAELKSIYERSLVAMQRYNEGNTEQVNPVTGRRVPGVMVAAVPERPLVSPAFYASDGLAMDPIVYQAVRHTVPMTLPEGHLMTDGVWAPARVAAAYIARLEKVKADMPEGAETSSIDQMISYLKKGVFVGMDYDGQPQDNIESAMAGVTYDRDGRKSVQADGRISPETSRSSGESVLIFPDENGELPSRYQMIDGIKLSDPTEEIEYGTMTSDREGLMQGSRVDPDAGFRAMRQIEDAVESGSEEVPDEKTLIEAEMFETSRVGDSIRQTQIREADRIKLGWESAGLGEDITGDAWRPMKAIEPSRYNPDTVYRDMFSGFQLELGKRDVGARRTGEGSYDEPSVRKATPARLFRRADVKPLGDVERQALTRVMTRLVFLMRYHAQRAKYWKLKDKNASSMAIIDELAQEFGRAIELAYEPNLRGSALMTGFVRRVEEVFGDDAFVETLWDEFVDNIGAQDRINSDAGWLGPDKYVRTKGLSQRSSPAIQLYKSYVASQVANTKFDMEKDRAPDIRMTGAYDSVTEGGFGEGGWQEEEDEVRYRAYPEEPTTSDVAQTGKRGVMLEEFAIPETMPRLPSAPYESRSQYVIDDEIMKLQERLGRMKAEYDNATSSDINALVAERNEIRSADPKSLRVGVLTNKIRAIRKIVANYEARSSAIKSQIARLRSEKRAGAEVVQQEFVVGQSYPEQGTSRPGINNYIRALIKSATGEDGTVNKARLKNDILLAWDLISMHHAMDENSPVRKFAQSRNQTGYEMAIVRLLESGAQVEIPMKWGDENSNVADPVTSEIRNPYMEMVRAIELGSRESQRTVVVSPEKLARVLEMTPDIGKDQVQWLEALAKNNPIALIWDKKTKSMWLQPEAENYPIKLFGQYGPKEKRKPVRKAYLRTDVDAERLIDSLGLSEIVGVERTAGPELSEAVLGGKTYKIVLKGSPVLTSDVAVPGTSKGSSESSLFRLAVDYQLRANFLGSIKDAMNQLGVDLSSEIDPLIQPIELTADGLSRLATDTKGEAIGPMAMEIEISTKSRAGFVHSPREVTGYQQPVRETIYSIIRRRSQGGKLTPQERELSELIESQIRTAEVAGPSTEETLAAQRRRWAGGKVQGEGPSAADIQKVNTKLSTPKIIGYGAGGAIAGVIGSYIGTSVMAGEEEAKAQVPMSAGFELVGALPKIGGPVAAVGALGLTAATGGDMWRTMFNIAGGFAGGLAGGAAGAFASPAGAIVGSVAGGTVGSAVADSVYTGIFGNPPENRQTVPANVAFERPKVEPEYEENKDTVLQNQINILGG